MNWTHAVLHSEQVNQVEPLFSCSGLLWQETLSLLTLGKNLEGIRWLHCTHWFVIFQHDLFSTNQLQAWTRLTSDVSSTCLMITSCFSRSTGIRHWQSQQQAVSLSDNPLPSKWYMQRWHSPGREGELETSGWMGSWCNGSSQTLEWPPAFRRKWQDMHVHEVSQSWSLPPYVFGQR